VAALPTASTTRSALASPGPSSGARLLATPARIKVSRRAAFDTISQISPAPASLSTSAQPRPMAPPPSTTQHAPGSANGSRRAPWCTA
jgi:hypothetical protein